MHEIALLSQSCLPRSTTKSLSFAKPPHGHSASLVSNSQKLQWLATALQPNMIDEDKPYLSIHTETDLQTILKNKIDILVTTVDT